MNYACVVALILRLVCEMESSIPPNFVLAIIKIENASLDPSAVNRNRNGTFDKGMMQLNSGWFREANWACMETNIRAGITHIEWLTQRPMLHSWWQIAVAYNCGVTQFVIDPPQVSMEYADRVMQMWHRLDPDGFNARGTIR